QPRWRYKAAPVRRPRRAPMSRETACAALEWPCGRLLLALRNRIFREDLLDPIEGLLGRRLWRHPVLDDFGPGGRPDMLVLDLGIGRIEGPESRYNLA